MKEEEEVDAKEEEEENDDEWMNFFSFDRVGPAERMGRETTQRTQEPSTAEILTSLDIESKGSNFLMTVYKFSRPHTIRGTVLAFFSGMIRVFLDNPEALAKVGLTNIEMWVTAFLGLFALLVGNAFIVGINQIYDVRIDKINKPFLPIASGELDIAGAWIIVLVSPSSPILLVCASLLLIEDRERDKRAAW